MPTAAPPTTTTLTRNKTPESLRQLIRRHDDLEALIAARRSHGLPSRDMWLALVGIEDRIADEHPAQAIALIAQWAQRTPATHPLGQQHPACPLCQSRHTPSVAAGGKTKHTASTTACAPLRR